MPRQKVDKSGSGNTGGGGAVIRRRVVPSRRRRDGLLQFAYNHTSQNGEDGILHRIFLELSGLELLSQNTTTTTKLRTRWCVDVGAWDGVHWSNTHSLLVPTKTTDKEITTATRNTKDCWKGILIEANLEKFEQLKALHEPLGNLCLGVTVSAQPGSPNSLAVLLQEQRRRQQQQRQQQSDHDDDDDPVLPLDFDFLCIDIDGMDYWVLYDLLKHSEFRPKVICVEFNPTMPDDLIYIPPPPPGDNDNDNNNNSHHHGCSLAALCELLCTSHESWMDCYYYVLVETTLYNAFFVTRDLYENTHLSDLVPDTSMEALHETTMGTYLYQLYDGTLKIWGCQKLLWHRIPIHESNIQMLPPQERVFPFAPPTASDVWSLQISAESIYDKFVESHTVVDMTPWCAALQPQQQGHDYSETSREEASAVLLDQLQHSGFAYVKAPLNPQICRDALRLTSAFLHDATEEIRRSCLTKDRARRGYSPMCTENFASLLGVGNGKNDLVRKFRMGPPAVEANNSLLQPNVWPSHEKWEHGQDFQQTMQEYYRQAVLAANGIVAAICQALIQQHPDLKASLEPFFNSTPEYSNDCNQCINPTTIMNSDSSILTLLGYRHGARHKQSKKNGAREPLVAAHTDVGVVTMLLFDQGDCATLQRVVLTKCKNDGPTQEWENVPLPPVVDNKDPIFVINVADCLSELSGGWLPSTLHRVVPAAAAATTKTSSGTPTPRNGMGLFVGLDPTQKLTFPRKHVDDKDEDEEGSTNQPAQRIMTFEQWRKERIARAQRAMQPLQVNE